MVEILAPVGNLNNLISAINAGADAVYLGLKDFSARKSADNFDFEELKYAVAYAKTFNVKVYLTVNTLVKESEINDFLSAINTAYSCGVDAFILQDIFLGKFIKDIMPNAVLHLSTQAGVCNVFGAKLAKRYGFSRVILARETKLCDIEEICKIIETEVFIQGALCTSLSGHCYFSSFIGGNSGNRGYCKQPCRKEYKYVVNGKTVKEGYLLSLSDLCVGENISLLKQIGVKSFKIEGRMRSKEYVASAIAYYKELLNGNNDQKLLNNLKISFNRGDYTKGLAFSQDRNFISHKVQSNIGLLVGKISKIFKDAIVFDSKLEFLDGDAFKILRQDYEVGNAIACNVNGKIIFKYKGNVKIGDDVRLTKKVDLYDCLGVKSKKKDIDVHVYIKENEKISLSALAETVVSSEVVMPAKTASATKDEVISNLNKTDIYPFKITPVFDEFFENAFIPKSVLNKLRAELYHNLFYKKIYKNAYNIEKYENIFTNKYPVQNYNKAVIVSEYSDNVIGFDNVIYAPLDYNNLNANLISKNVWLYLPPFMSYSDIEIVKGYINKFKGVYADGVWAIEFCKDLGLKLFAGVGFNVFNSIDLNALYSENVYNVCASKELSLSDIKNLSSNLFVLSDSSIEIMDLIYCPFSKNCKNCEIIDNFELVDSEGRTFKVKRYKTTDCRFKVYNSAKIKKQINVNTITDLSILNINDYTNGNYIKGVK